MFPFDIEKVVYQLTYHAEEPLIFNSGLFLFLFAGFVTIYYYLSPNLKAKLIFVTLFSLYFYYKSSGFYFLLLLLATVTDFFLARFIFESQNQLRRKVLVIASLAVNLSVLAYFKYANFLVGSFFGAIGGEYQPMDIFLPVGISFFTFQSLSYTIDVYRKQLVPVGSILDYAFYLSFFPQLVAGPIVRAADFLPQIHRPAQVTNEMLGRGVFLIITGLFKKAVISDYISINFVDRVFDAPALYSGMENLASLYGYALQIYCDFSGYSDMAIGIALLLGFHFNRNFDSPYQSASITEFWRRWHISLSTWLRDYLYVSLGGNRKGRIRTYLNLMITMLLGGLWHGAAWRFVIWGGLHGAALAFHKMVTPYLDFRSSRLWNAMGVVITFHFVCFCWLFFRAPDVPSVMTMLSRILLDFKPELLPEFINGYQHVVLLMAAGYVLHFLPSSAALRFEKTIVTLPLFWKAACIVAVIFLVVQVKSAQVQPFIYFQF